MTTSRRHTALLVALIAVVAGASGLVAGSPQGARPTEAPGQTPKGTGIVVGQVVDGSTGQPIAEAIVSMNARAAAPLPPARGAAPVDPAAAAGGRRGAPAAPDRIMTGGDGRFLFRDLPAGSVMFTATAPGYGNGLVGQTRPGGPSKPVDLPESARVHDVKIRLWRNATITGTIVDEASDPAVRTAVRVLRRTMSAGRPRFVPVSAAMTDDRGMYRISGLPAGDYLVVVPQTQATVPAAFAESFIKSMASGGAGQGGMMLDLMASDGTPPNPNGVRVGDYLLSSNGNAGALPPAPSGDGPLMAYQTMLFPAATSPAQATVISLTSGEERGGINIQMRLVRTVRVSGSVTGPTGPVANVGVRLFPASGSDLLAETEFPVATSMTSADGSFVFLAVPAGQFVVRVQKASAPAIPAELASNPLIQMAFGNMPGGRGGAASATLYAQANVSVGSTDTADIALRLHEGAKLSGRVEFDGASPPPPATALQTLTITLTPMEARAPSPGNAFGNQNAQSGRVGGDGQFTTAGYPPGQYLFSAAGRGGGPAWTLKSALANGRDITNELLDLSDADVTGVVVTYTDKVGQLTGTIRTANGAPPDEASVLLFPADYRAWIRNGMSPRRLAVATIAKSSAFTLPRLLAGEYLIAAVPTTDPADRDDPSFFDALARVATRVVLGEGEQRAVELALVKVTR